MAGLTCETLILLEAIGASKGGCPWISQCKRDLPGDECELALTAEALDKSKQSKIKILPSDLDTNSSTFLEF